MIYFLKNFFLPYPANPIKPEPRRSMVAGSGTPLVVETSWEPGLISQKEVVP
jgi:hypothetical protein